MFYESLVMHERIDELEIRLAFQEEQIDALNLTVVRQQQELDTLRRQFDELVRLLRAQSSPQDGSERWHARDDIPPHY